MKKIKVEMQSIDWGLLRVDVFFFDTSASKSAISSQGYVKILDFQDFGWFNLLNDYLGDSVMFPKSFIKQITWL